MKEKLGFLSSRSSTTTATSAGGGAAYHDIVAPERLEIPSRKEQANCQRKPLARARRLLAVVFSRFPPGHSCRPRAREKKRVAKLSTPVNPMISTAPERQLREASRCQVLSGIVE